MPINPIAPSPSGTLPGVVARTSDLDRRLRMLEARRGAVIADGSITGTKIADGSITASHIEAGSIIVSIMQANEIETNHLAAEAVTAAKIAAGTITTHEIYAGDVEANKIQAANIAAGTISTALLDAEAVTADKIAAGAVTADKIAAGAVTAEDLDVINLSALSGDLGNITAGNIVGASFKTAASGARVELDSLGMRGYGLDGTTEVFSIDAGSGIASFTGIAQLDPSSVVPGGTVNNLPGDHIVAGTVDTAQLAAGAVKANTIDAGAINASHLTIAAIDANGNLSADSVGSTQISPDSILAQHIKAGEVTSDKLYAGTIQANLIQGINIAANSITAAQIDATSIRTAILAAGKITATDISVTALSGISANLGTITAGTIHGAELDVTAPTTTNPNTLPANVNRVRWLRDTDNALTGDVLSMHLDYNQSGIVIDQHITKISASYSTYNRRAEISMGAGSGTSIAANILPYAGGAALTSVVLLGSDGTSQFHDITLDTGWYRSTGATGWYSKTFGGGIYMTDSAWVRVYGGADKGFYVPGGVSYGEVGLYVGNTGVVGGARFCSYPSNGGANTWNYHTRVDVQSTYQDLATGGLFAGGTAVKNPVDDLAGLVDARPDDRLEAGELVCIDTDVEYEDGWDPNFFRVRRATASDADRVLGVLSSKRTARLMMGAERWGRDGTLDIDANSDWRKLIAYSGVIPTKVTMENGAILAGDRLCMANEAGRAMRATQAGHVIGIALRDCSEDGEVIMLVAPGWWAGKAQKKRPAKKRTRRQIPVEPQVLPENWRELVLGKDPSGEDFGLTPEERTAQIQELEEYRQYLIDLHEEWEAQQHGAVVAV